jgi:hypothetical protein
MEKINVLIFSVLLSTILISCASKKASCDAYGNTKEIKTNHLVKKK